jgi:peptidoglycan/LPS O-acetylase OafA/YrhL
MTTGVAGQRSGRDGTATAVRDGSSGNPVREWKPLTEHRAGYRPDVEGLRAVAIVLVVLYHAGIAWLPGGFVGVDVFFVISGFLIVSQLVREADRSGRLRVGRFYGRRILRLLPAAVTVLTVTLLATWWWLPSTRLRSVVWDVVAANGYVLNYRLAWLGTDYRTATSAPSPVQHFWSLAVEEQFYLVVPVLVLALLVWMRSRTALVLALTALTGASLWWSMRSTPVSPIWAYFGAPSRIWELGAGALLALAVSAGLLAGRPAVLGSVLQWSGLGLIGVAAVRFGEMTAFPGSMAAVPVSGAVLVIAGGCISTAAVRAVGPDPESAEFAWNGGILGWPILQSIGARSYSWYLWHWPVLLIGPFALSREFGTIGRLGLVAVAFAFAAATYSMVELPLRQSRELRDRPVSAGGLGLALTAGVVGLALLLPMVPSRTPLGMSNVEQVALSGSGSARTKALAQKIKAASRVEDLPANLTPALKKAAKDDPLIYRNGCHLDFADLATPRKCESLGDRKGRKVIVLFGDSHAAQWFPAMNKIAVQRHARLAVFTKGACSAADVKIYLPPVKRGYSECVTWRKAAMARIRALHPTVIVTSSNADGGDPQGLSGTLDGKWSKAWTRTTKRLAAPGTQVVYLNDTPWPKGNVPDCLAQHPRSIQKCEQSPKRAVGSARRSMMARAVAKAGATVVDPMPWFCSLSACPVVVGNILVYKDESHISTVYAKLLAPLLGEKLDQ